MEEGNSEAVGGKGLLGRGSQRLRPNKPLRNANTMNDIKTYCLDNNPVVLIISHLTLYPVSQKLDGSKINSGEKKHKLCETTDT